MLQWTVDQTEVTKRIGEALWSWLYAVTSSQCNAERWQRTTGTAGTWPCGTHPNLTHNVQYSAFISLPVVCTRPTDSHTFSDSLWAPKHCRLCWGHSLPQLVRFVLTGRKEPQEQGCWCYSPPESCCSQGGLLRLTDQELNRLGASWMSCLILFYTGRWERWSMWGVEGAFVWYLVW